MVDWNFVQFGWIQKEHTDFQINNFLITLLFVIPQNIIQGEEEVLIGFLFPESGVIFCVLFSASVQSGSSSACRHC